MVWNHVLRIGTKGSQEWAPAEQRETAEWHKKKEQDGLYKQTNQEADQLAEGTGQA